MGTMGSRMIPSTDDEFAFYFFDNSGFLIPQAITKDMAYPMHIITYTALILSLTVEWRSCG